MTGLSGFVPASQIPFDPANVAFWPDRSLFSDPDMGGELDNLI
jgi:hypothetical protein